MTVKEYADVGHPEDVGSGEIAAAAAVAVAAAAVVAAADGDGTVARMASSLLTCWTVGRKRQQIRTGLTLSRGDRPQPSKIPPLQILQRISDPGTGRVA